ncbi:helicase IV, partial [Pseudomonas neuropathica]
QEERIIANWLFYNGIDYQYERSYEHDTATVTHRQYFPDFFYPDINLYHEHFALDALGQAPVHFRDYLDGVVWKRATHQKLGTALI